jgi:hypothetical protein
MEKPPVPQPTHLTRAESVVLGKRRRGRNIALLIALLSIAALFYAIAIVKLGGTLGMHH